jgi:hypothetical protein
MAEDAVTLGAEIGAGGRAPGFALPAEDALGLNVAGRLELVIPAALRARADVRYLEGQFTEDSGQRFFDLSVAGSFPTIILLCADVHEFYLRQGTNPSDDIVQFQGGLGFRAKLLGSLKGGFGVAYFDQPGATAERANAVGGYAGAEYLARFKWVDLSARASLNAGVSSGEPILGVVTDGDLTIRIPVGKVSIGPRLDLQYRNLGLLKDRPSPFLAPEEFTGSLGLAVVWGSGGK